MLNILGHTAEGATSNLVQSADFIEKNYGRRSSVVRGRWRASRRVLERLTELIIFRGAAIGAAGAGIQAERVC